MLASKAADESLRHILFQEEHTMGQDHHALLASRQHDVRSPLVLHEPRSRRTDDRKDDVVFFISLEGVDVEDGVLPHDTLRLECILDRISLGIIWSDDFEVFSLPDVAFGDMDCGFNLTFVLSNRRVFSIINKSCPSRSHVPPN